MNDYGITPEQYHANLDKLWAAVSADLTHPKRDIFTLCVDRIKELEELNKKMHSQVSGYLSGKEWEHWQEFNEGRFKC